MVWAEGHKLQGGKYEIIEKLGEGGFGITYKVLHTRFNKYFVIKTIHEYLRNKSNFPAIAKRFEKEATRLKKLSKQKNLHIVGVQDFFTEGEVDCLVMDFVAGKNLFQIVGEQGKILDKEARKYIEQIVKALNTVHQAGLTHRDVHPGNIMINQDNRAILIDFGLTKEINPQKTTSEGLAGNRAFAPYEQFYKGNCEPNVDVYSLAASWYFILTGQYPIDALSRRLNGVNLIPPKNINPHISSQVNNAIVAGMELEPENRPQSIKAWWKLVSSDTHEEFLSWGTTSPSPSRRKRKKELSLLKVVSSTFSSLSNKLIGLFHYFTSGSSDLFNVFFRAIAGVFSWIIDFFSLLINLLETLFEYLTSTIIAIFTSFFSTIKTIFSWVLPLSWILPSRTLEKIFSSPHIWGCLLIVILSYGFFGFMAAEAGAVARAVAVTWSGAMVWAGAVTGAAAMTGASTVTVAGAMAVAGSMAVAVTWTRVMAWAMAGAVAMAGAGTLAFGLALTLIQMMYVTGAEEAFEQASFHWLEMSLILLYTSLLGVGLGWLTYDFLN